MSGFNLTEDNVNGACFVAVTRIKTNTGLFAIECLVAGQMVATLDNGMQPVRHVLTSTVKGRGALDPVVFSKGTWGAALREVAVSSMHLIFDAPDIILSEGIASEGFHPNPDAVVYADTPAELLMLFPELQFGLPQRSVRCVLRWFESQMLAQC